MKNTTDKASLEMRNVHKSYGKSKILNNVNLEMRGGQIYGLAAPNGAGKSTLMKCFVNLCFFSGLILYNDQEIDSGFNGQIIYAPDTPFFAESQLTVLQHLWKIAIMKNLQFSIVSAKLHKSSLSAFAETQCAALSTGWKKVLQIFIENLTNPQVLLLDEPFNGLDRKFRLLIVKIIVELAAEGKIILIASHTIHDLESIADLIFVLKNGELQSSEDHQGSFTEFYAKFFNDQK